MLCSSLLTSLHLYLLLQSVCNNRYKCSHDDCMRYLLDTLVFKWIVASALHVGGMGTSAESSRYATAECLCLLSVLEAALGHLEALEKDMLQQLSADMIQVLNKQRISQVRLWLDEVDGCCAMACIVDVAITSSLLRSDPMQGWQLWEAQANVSRSSVLICSC